MRLGKRAKLSQEKTEIVPELVTNAPKKKQQIFSFWGVTTILGIFGTLGFIALPSFLNCANPAKQAEAKTYIGSINRAQQANFEEKKAFANSFEALDLGIIASQTVNFNYSIRTTKTASLQYAIPRNKSLKSYVGGVFVIPATTNKSEITTASILCGSLKSGLTTPIAPKLVKGVPTCGSGTKEGGVR